MDFADYKKFQNECMDVVTKCRSSFMPGFVCEMFDKLIRVAIDSKFPHRPTQVETADYGVLVVMVDNTGEWGSFTAVGRPPN